ncbi:unnamed protein product [Ilex paraguariensis]|uniref:Uncharacterized protein n=1 Tax=Ilex paraguariensis TaxID=185542 RepID=A0ABC8RSI5_9AQUA
MRWEKSQIKGGPEECGGPGKRWGHTCNAIRGGKFLYVFGGYGKDNCQTNQVHVFDAVKGTWSLLAIKGTPPVPRDSHSCTAVGDNLFVFGGTDGKNPLKDLHILDTATNTWMTPSVRGEGPEAREGHSAALIGKRLFIFGGCGKSSNSSDEEYYEDLYILNTETFVWKRAATSGTPPAKRDSHTCSAWKNKIIVIGGEDSCDYYLSDVYILDADTLVWGKLSTSGELLPPRAGHTAVALGKNLFVFGGFTDEQSLFDDIYMLDVDTGVWTKVMATGEGPSARFSMAGDSLDPQKGGVLVFIGGCNKNLEALDDMYYLYTGIATDNERDERRLEKLSLRKQLKLKCQEQHIHDKALVRVETDSAIYQHMPGPTYMQPSKSPLGKRTFQAKVTKSLSNGYTIETVIDGKPLHGVLFSNKPCSKKTAEDDSTKKKYPVELGDTKVNDNQNSGSENAGSLKQDVITDMQVDSVHKMSISPVPQMEAAPASMPLEVHGELKLSISPTVKVVDNQTSDAQNSGVEDPKENTSAAAKDCVTLDEIKDIDAMMEPSSLLVKQLGYAAESCLHQG